MKKSFPIFFVLILFGIFLIPKVQAQTPDYTMTYKDGMYVSADGLTKSPIIGDFINAVLSRIEVDSDKGVGSPSSSFYGVTGPSRAAPMLYAAENCSWSDTACIARNNAAQDANMILMSNYNNTYFRDVCESNNSLNPASMSRSCSTMFPVTNYPKLTIPMQPAVCPVGTGQCYTPILGDKPYSGATSGSGMPSGGSTGTNYSGSGSTLPGSSSGLSTAGTGSVSSWATNTLNILRNMTSIAQSIMTSQISRQVVTGTTGTVPSPVAPVSAVSNSRIQDIISQANVLLYSSLSVDEQTALTNYLTTNRSALLDQNFQTFAPGSVFAWALSMGTSTTLNDLAKSLGFTNLNPTNPDPAMWRFVKAPSAATATTVPVSTPTNANICCSFTGWYECGGSIPYNPSPVLTPYYKEGVSTLGTRQCGVQPANTANTISFPATIIVTADILNVRSDSNTQSIIVKQLTKGQTFSVSNVKDGEVVDGNGKWWVTLVGSAPAYIWSGGATVIQ